MLQALCSTSGSGVFGETSYTQKSAGAAANTANRPPDVIGVTSEIARILPNVCLEVRTGSCQIRTVSQVTEQVFKYLPDWLARFLSLQWLPNIRWLRRIIVAVIGFTVLLIGVAMIVLPGPALVVIPLGLAILATEFVWARRVLKKAKGYFNKGKEKLTGKK